MFKPKTWTNGKDAKCKLAQKQRRLTEESYGILSKSHRKNMKV